MNIELDLGGGAASRPSSFLQSTFWGDFKSSFGWKAQSFTLRLAKESGQESGECPLLVLERRLAGPYSFAYIPGGPGLEPPAEGGTALLSLLARKLSPYLLPSCLFIRFDPPWSSEESSEEKEGSEIGTEIVPIPPPRPLLGSPLRRAAADVQPPDSVILDLEGEEPALLGGMKPKWRYNIRLAEKRDVVVTEEGPESLPIFYGLYEATSRRDRIALHPEAYYARLFELAAQKGAPQPRPDLRLWIARHEGEALAAIVTLFYGKSAIYLYGASSDRKRNLMPAYALQWAAIRAAKASGCASYDFYGIPPRADPGHPMAGLYRFKTGFGGRIVHYAGSWDYPLHPLLYSAFRRAESLRGFYFKRLRKIGKGGGSRRETGQD